MRFIACLLVLLCVKAQAAGMLELRYQDQDPGSEPYLTRILISDRFVRLDGGEDSGDFVLFDRKSRRVVNVLHDQKILMRMHNRPLPRTRPQDYKLDEKTTPVKKGTLRVQVLADGKLCSETVSAKGLQPDAVRALSEYKSALAYTQLQTYLNTPADLRQACDLAHHVWDTGRALSYGLPIEERDYEGRLRQFSGSAMKRLNPALFKLPKGYVTMQPPEGDQTAPSVQPSPVQTK